MLARGGRVRAERRHPKFLFAERAKREANQRNFSRERYPITTDFGLQRRSTSMKRAALYVRVSTDRQTVENQIAALSKVAQARGWQIVETFSDAGISGAKGRKDRPGSTSC